MVDCSFESSKLLKKSVGAIVDSLAFFFVLSSSCLGAGDGPPRFQVEQDWRTLINADQNCSRCVRISRITVLDIDAKKKTATARIEVIGDWIGAKDCRSAGGACSGFSSTGGIHQVVGKTLRYRRLDSGWKLETKVGKSKSSHGRRHSSARSY